MTFSYVLGTTDGNGNYIGAVPDEGRIGCDFSVALTCNGNNPQPQLVNAIKINALNAYVAAFASLPAIVSQRQKFPTQMLYGGSKGLKNFEHTAYIDGSWEASQNGEVIECGYTGLTKNKDWSWVFYPNNECNGELTLGPYNQNNPDFTPPLSDATNMLALFSALGRGLGNIAVHETAWQISFTTPLSGMECGIANQEDQIPKPCQDGINSVYESYLGLWN